MLSSQLIGGQSIMKKKYTLTVREKGTLKDEKSYKITIDDNERNIYDLFKNTYKGIIGIAILICIVFLLLGMLAVDQAISLMAGIFAFFLSICVVLNDYNKIKFQHILPFSYILTMSFLIIYLLLAPEITLSENLKCFRLVNIGNTLTFIGLIFSAGMLYYQKIK